VGGTESFGGVSCDGTAGYTEITDQVGMAEGDGSSFGRGLFRG